MASGWVADLVFLRVSVEIAAGEVEAQGELVGGGRVGQEEVVGEAGEALGGLGGEAGEAGGEPGLRGDGDLGAAVRLTAWKMRSAACLTEAERMGVRAAARNQAFSFSTWPMNWAWTSPPVRIRPGQTVVTRMPLWRSSACRPSEKPMRANLLAV